jgi:hypothetical protein
LTGQTGPPGLGGGAPAGADAVVSPERREAIVRRWLDLTLRAYPDQTARFLRDTADPFHNPVGAALRKGLPLLVDHLTGGAERRPAEAALDEIVHIRAVQDFTPGEAVGFIFLAKRAVGEDPLAAGPGFDEFSRRVDELAMLAFDLYMRCREKLWEIRADAAKRQMYVPERMAAGRRATHR